jgi:hypothetical protein
MLIERVSTPSSPEAIEPLQNDQSPRRLINTIPALKGEAFRFFVSPAL